MYSIVRFLEAAIASLLLSQAAAIAPLQVRQNSQDAASTSFSGAVPTQTTSSTAVATGSGSGGNSTTPTNPADRSQISYLQSMCAPTSTSTTGAGSSNGIDTRFPCNVVSNITLTCIYNLTSPQNKDGEPAQLDASAQQQCLCPGGAGEAIWENAEGCDECLRLHGASSANGTGGGLQFIPSAFVKDLSSAYCAMPTASLNYENFATNFTVTHPVSYGTATGGVDVLKGKTAVSDYFTSSFIAVNTTSSPSTSAPNTSAPARTGGGDAQSTAANQPTSSPSPSATKATGGAASTKVSGLLGVGILGVALLL